MKFLLLLLVLVTVSVMPAFSETISIVLTKMRKRGLRWLHRHGHLDDMAVHIMDSADHAGGWSANASVTIPDWDGHGLERLVRYCGVPASNAKLRKAVIETACPSGATLQLLTEARDKMEIGQQESSESQPQSRIAQRFHL